MAGSIIDVFLDAAESAVIGKVDKNNSTFTKVGEEISGIANFAVLVGKKGTEAGVKQKYKTGYVRKADIADVPKKTVTIPANFAGLEAVDIPTRLREQYFDIVEVVENEDYVEIRARHIWYRNLQNNTLWKPEDDTSYTASQVCRYLLENAVFPPNFDVATDCTESLPAKELDFERKNLVEAFLDPENGVCKKFGLSLIRDNTRFYCLKNVGYDRGFVVQNGKNMLGVERIENLENVATRIAPIGKTKKGEIVWLDYNGLKYIDSQYVNDYPQPRLEIYDTGIQIGKDDVTEQNIQAKLLEAAQNRFSEDEVDKPEVTMTVQFLSLGDTEEYRQYRDLDKVYLYDIITIRDTVRGYNYSAQVVGVEHDVLTGMLLSVTIGSLKQADASRKIAVWQVPEIDGSNIRLLSIQAGSFAPEAIQTADLAPYIITADKIISGEIETRHLAAEAVTTEKLDAGAVTAGKIDAGAVTTEKLDAYAVTAAKIDAGAVETDKLAAGSVTADKISATDINAINAKLGTATIANAQIATADINFAHIKDLNAQSAYFGQTIFDEGVGGKLYVPRLSVGYAQMIGATIGDLVIQASNGRYYGIDVDMSGNVTATERTVTAGEIAAGHTSDGRTLVLGTDILATDLNTENIYASHALMSEITAATINVDELWARQAFIGHLMTTDISSNTYIQSRIIDKIGNWTSTSTITQSINSLNTKITQLGYGTVYFQPNEPDHENLTEGDIWVKSSNVQDWNDLYSRQEDGQYVFADWEAVYNAFDDWQTLCAVDRMFVWTGVNWKEMYDAQLPNHLETEINQLASEITLKASRTEVDWLADEVTEFSAQLTIQADEIQSAVSAVNLKAASYVMQADPRTAYTVSVGDIWIKWDGVTDWQDIYNRYDDWTGIYNTFGDWSEFIGSKSYVWNGFEWVETSDRASEINQRTLIDQTINQITLLAEASATIGDDLYRTKAELQITNDSIRAEVERATTAEGGKLDKTTQYQTADAIVSEAVSQSATAAGETYLAKTTRYQTADAIVTEAVRQSGTNADSNYLKKTTTYQDATSIVTAAVSQAGTNANSNFIKKSGTYTSVDAILSEAQAKADAAATSAKSASIAKTQTYQTATAIVNAAVAAAETSASGTYLAKTENYQTADSIVSAAESYVDGELEDYSTTTQTSTMISTYVGKNAYGKVSGITITAEGIDISGSQYVKIASGGAFRVTSGNFGIKSDAGTNEYVIWSGASTAAASQFRVKKNGAVTLTKLLILNESGTETEVNLRTYGLWKLNYHVIKNYTANSITLSNGEVVNFNTAAGVVLSGGWTDNWTKYTVTATDSAGNVVGTQSSGAVSLMNGSAKATRANVKKSLEDSNAHTVLLTVEADGEDIAVLTVDASGVYTQGANGVSVTRVTLGSKITGTQYNCSVLLDSGNTRGSTINCATPYSDGQKAVTANTGSWSAGKRTITLSSPNTNTYEITIPNGTGWKLENTADKTAKATVTVGEKELTHTFTYDWINHGDYAEGKADGIEEYYNSSYWAPATAANNWTPQIPNSTNTGSVGWTTSGASDAFNAGKNGVTVTSVTLGSKITGTQYSCSVLLSSGNTRAGTVNLQAAYSDARAGYTLGTFTQYSGAQLYTMGQSGPEKYTGTLYVKS